MSKVEYARIFCALTKCLVLFTGFNQILISWLDNNTSLTMKFESMFKNKYNKNGMHIKINIWE